MIVALGIMASHCIWCNGCCQLVLIRRRKNILTKRGWLGEKVLNLHIEGVWR